MNWKDISGFEGLYKVSDCGQVKSLPRKGSLKERILKLGLNNSGYHHVCLCKDGKQKTFQVHRLVALAFLDGDNTLTVNHIDECKANNHVSNLEYLSNTDNIRAWNKNNPERKAEIIKKAAEAAQKACSQQVLDTQNGKTFPSIIAASRYMHEEEGAKGPWAWYGKIRSGQQDRFQIIDCSR